MSHSDKNVLLTPVDPFLKWAGGKRRLRDSILAYLPRPEEGRRYFEPFLGGGAVFFALRPEQAVLSDLNPELIETFCAVRDDVEAVIERVAVLRNDKPSSIEFEVNDQGRAQLAQPDSSS